MKKLEIKVKAIQGLLLLAPDDQNGGLLTLPPFFAVNYNSISSLPATVYPANPKPLTKWLEHGTQILKCLDK